jgi:tetratricopeptide (TPR) repeat protein
MRVTLSDPTLVRQAGRFVWLELNYDDEANQAFLARHGIAWTPVLLVLDPSDEHVTASHVGGMSLAELQRFLEEGERGFRSAEMGSAAAAVSRGDAAGGRGQLVEATEAYREALRLGAGRWAQRGRAVDALVGALQVRREWHSCADTVTAEAPALPRESSFARIVHMGLGCANVGEDAPWAQTARRTLEPLAVEATAIEGVPRDDSFQLYEQLMVAAQLRGAADENAKWGRRWLQEIDRVVPSSDDERSGLDVARVDLVLLLDEPLLALKALEASERAMPLNYTASARLARVAEAAQRHDEALSACNRGLQHVDGPIGRTGLLLTKASALRGKGELSRAKETAQLALRAARSIPNAYNRANAEKRASDLIARLESR